VFCSQVCLLLMRHLIETKALVTDPVCQHHIQTVSSRGCSPNMLHHIVSKSFRKI
jgi:hypothetical protein